MDTPVSSSSSGLSWVNPATSLGAAAIGAITTSLENKKNRQFQQEEADKQRVWSERQYQQQLADNITLWNMQNAYDSPAAQMQRKAAAGINTAFDVEGLGSSGAISPAQSLGYERAENFSYQNPVSAGFDSAMRVAQIQNMRSQTALNSGLTLTEEQRRENMIKEREQMDANIKKLLSSANLTEKQAEQIQKYLDYADELYRSQIDLNDSTKGLNDEHKRRISELLEGEKALQQLQQDDFRHKWDKWQAEIDHLFAEDEVLKKQAEYYLISLLNNGFAGTGFSIKNMLISALIDNDEELDDQLKDTIREAFLGKPQKFDKSKLRRGVERDKHSSSTSYPGLVPNFE